MHLFLPYNKRYFCNQFPEERWRHCVVTTGISKAPFFGPIGHSKQNIIPRLRPGDLCYYFINFLLASFYSSSRAFFISKPPP